jgi:hypothetical protein
VPNVLHTADKPVAQDFLDKPPFEEQPGLKNVSPSQFDLSIRQADRLNARTIRDANLRHKPACWILCTPYQLQTAAKPRLR